MSKRQLLAVIASTSLTLCAAPGCGSSDTTAAPAAGTDGATSATAGGGGSVGAGGAAGEGGRGGGVAPAPLVPAEGVSFDQIAIYQGPKRSLLGGPPSPSGVDVPVVAGRDAIVRLFLSAGSTYDGSPVTARLFLGDDPVPMEATAAVRAGDEGDLATTVNLEIPGARIVPGVDYHVELLQPPDHASGAGEGARHPATGATSVGVSSDGPTLKLVLVPIVYGADGSDRIVRVPIAMAATPCTPPTA